MTAPMVEVFCACTAGWVWGVGCPSAAAVAATPDGAPVTLAAVEGWARTVAGWVCPNCTRHQPPEPA